MDLATMADVAKEAGVSIATVSHVLNGTRYVSPEATDRVSKAIQVTGYRRHQLARALRRDRTDLVGLVASDTGHPIFSEIVHGVEEQARKLGLQLLLSNASEEPVREAELLNTLREHRADGVLIVPAAGTDGKAIVDLLEDECPVVIVDRLRDVACDQVGVDSVTPLRALTRHLIDNGHRRIAVVAGDRDLLINKERIRACVQVMDEAGIPRVDQTVLQAAGTDAREDPVGTARDLVSDYVDDPDRATAFVALNAHQTVGTLTALRSRMLKVPDDVALVAFDDLPWPDLITPGVTCARQPAEDLGRVAMQLLARRIENPEVPNEIVRLECELIHRESCGCPTHGRDATSWR